MSSSDAMDNMMGSTDTIASGVTAKAAKGATRGTGAVDSRPAGAAASNAEGAPGDDDRDDDQLDALVRSRTDELGALASYLQRTHEEENRKLARELHDELGSLLTAAKLDITFIKSKCTKTAPELVAKCERIASMIDQATTLKRKLIDQLRPSTLDMLGLAPALRELVDNFASDSGIATVVDIADEAVTPAPSLAIYRVVEDALATIRDNGRAANIRVTVERSPGSIILRVVHDGDDGNAGNAGNAGDGHMAAAIERPLSVARAGMRQRVAAIGGRISFDGAPGRGSTITATFPLDPPAA